MLFCNIQYLKNLVVKITPNRAAVSGVLLGVILTLNKLKIRRREGL